MVNSPKSTRRQLSRFFALYVASAATFALVYWVVWLMSPDSFILHAELNLLPIENLRNFSWDGTSPVGETFSTDDLVTLSVRARTEIESYRRLSRLVPQIEKEIERLRSQDEAASKELMNAMVKEFDDYKDRILEPFKNTTSGLAATAADLRERIKSTKDPAYRSHLEVEEAQVQVEIARINVRQARETVRIYDMFLSDLTRFQDPAMVKKSHALVDLLRNTETRLDQARSEQGVLRSKMHDIWVKAREARAGRLNYVDFLYFSLGVSTTVTFGDIIPNNRIVRGVAIAQILLSIFLVGTLVTGISDSLLQRRKHDGTQVGAHIEPPMPT
jgi:hypothetical protein